MSNLTYNLSCKQELKFRPDGSFKILMMSDIQETLEYDPRTLEGMHRLVEKVAPDLVFLGGDNCNGLVLRTKEELVEYLKIFSAPMERRKIPWAHVFGNHDHDILMDDVEKTKLYEKFPYCVSKHTENIPGTTNFVLPIKSSDGKGIAFTVWGAGHQQRIPSNRPARLRTGRPSMGDEGAGQRVALGYRAL